MSNLTHTHPPAAQSAKTLSATAMARAPFADILASARRGPLTVTHKGKPAAVILSAARYQKMLRAVLKLMEEAEDQEWAQKARRAQKEGFIPKAEAAALTRRLRKIANGN